jgi:hypothetical protein
MPSGDEMPFPLFYRVTLHHFDTGTRVTVPFVERQGAGDCLRLQTWIDEDAIADDTDKPAIMAFDTRCLKVNTGAQQHMKRFFPTLTATADAVVCLGDMTVDDIKIPLQSVATDLMDALFHADA